MLTQLRLLLAVLAVLACAEGVTLPRSTLLIPRPRDTAPASTDKAPTRGLAVNTPKGPLTPVSQDARKLTAEASLPPISNTRGVIATTKEGPLTLTSENVTRASTVESQPPILSRVFTTDAATGRITLTLPGNESASSLLFWSSSAGTSVTFTILPRNYNTSLTTILPRHWHTIDVYQPIEDLNTTARLDLHTAGRYINLDYSRVVQVQVGSDDPIHWCFCPNPHLCAFPSPEEAEHEGGVSGGLSAERVGLMVTLVVVGLLLVASLVALAGVAFYRKAELFHVYAKPIDCLQSVPPPLPKANSVPLRRHVDMTTQAKKAETANGAAVTGKTDDLEYSTVIDDLRRSKVGGEAVEVTAAQPRPASLHHAYPHLPSQERQKRHESINNLYGFL